MKNAVKVTLINLLLASASILIWTILTTNIL